MKQALIRLPTTNAFAHSHLHDFRDNVQSRLPTIAGQVSYGEIGGGCIKQSCMSTTDDVADDSIPWGRCTKEGYASWVSDDWVVRGPITVPVVRHVQKRMFMWQYESTGTKQHVGITPTPSTVLRSYYSPTTQHIPSRGDNPGPSQQISQKFVETATTCFEENRRANMEVSWDPGHMGMTRQTK